MLPFERAQPDLGTEDEVVRERIVAVVIDTVSLWIVTGLLTEIAARISVTLGALTASLGVVGFFGYFVYFEVEYGQTLGKMATNVAVVTEKGRRLTYRDAAVRNVLRVVDWLPALYLAGFVAIHLTDREQRVGDLVADTVVVRTYQKGDKL